jgi:hypothetical protein
VFSVQVPNIYRVNLSSLASYCGLFRTTNNSPVAEPLMSNASTATAGTCTEGPPVLGSCWPSGIVSRITLSLFEVLSLVVADPVVLAPVVSPVVAPVVVPVDAPVVSPVVAPPVVSAVVAPVVSPVVVPVVSVVLVVVPVVPVVVPVMRVVPVVVPVVVDLVVVLVVAVVAPVVVPVVVGVPPSVHSSTFIVYSVSVARCGMSDGYCGEP